MSTAIEKLSNQEESICALVTGGDASKLTPEQRTQYYLMRCKTAGLDPRAQPFQFMNLQGKLILYALKACSDQLSSVHGIRVEVVEQETTPDGIRVVTVRAIAKDGRQTDEIGCVSIKGKTSDDLANAYMKAVTKAKRRAILSLCGLGCSDETELETIPGATVVPIEAPKEIKRPQSKKTQEAIDNPAPAVPVPTESFDANTGEVFVDPSDAQEQPLDEIMVTDVTMKDGLRADKTPYRVYFITCSDGKIYTSFDNHKADAEGLLPHEFAQLAKDQKRGVLITAEAPKKNKAGKEYFPIVSIA